jgi:hypothetical protein
MVIIVYRGALVNGLESCEADSNPIVIVNVFLAIDPQRRDSVSTHLTQYVSLQNRYYAFSTLRCMQNMWSQGDSYGNRRFEWTPGD